MQVCIPRTTHVPPWGTNDPLTNRIAEPPPITSRSTHPPRLYQRAHESRRGFYAILQEFE